MVPESSLSRLLPPVLAGRLAVAAALPGVGAFTFVVPPATLCNYMEQTTFASVMNRHDLLVCLTR